MLKFNISRWSFCKIDWGHHWHSWRKMVITHLNCFFSPFYLFIFYFAWFILSLSFSVFDRWKRNIPFEYWTKKIMKFFQKGKKNVKRFLWSTSIFFFFRSDNHKRASDEKWSSRSSCIQPAVGIRLVAVRQPSICRND